MDSAHVIVRSIAAILYAALVYLAASQPALPGDERAVSQTTGETAAVAQRR